MKNHILKSTAVVAIMLSMVVGVGGAFAQNSSSAPVSTSGSASASGAATLTVPAGYTVIPPKDADRSDDQIIQLENLTIQKISGTVPGLVYASINVGGPCREYFDVSGVSGSRAYPCPLAPTVLYQISVGSDTILLLRDRTRATIGEFAVGDRINVFGFLDRGTSYVQALIMRDLDKPANSQYVQLNNLAVLTDPGSEAPTTFRAARRGVDPCLLFGSVSAVRGFAAPCPMGVDLNASAQELSGPNADLYRPYANYYNINVTDGTRIMNLYRQSMHLADVSVGDRINVYGRYVPGTRTVEALIMRDLSVPRPTGQASITVTLTDEDIVCITTPCGEINGMRVDLNILHPGADKSTFVASQTTVNGRVAFRNLMPGTYIVTASGAGYAEVEQRVALTRGESKTLNLFTSKIEADSGLRLLEPNGGEVIRLGSTVEISWSSDGGVVRDGYALVLSLIDGPSQGSIATIENVDARGSHKWEANYVVIGGDAISSIQPGRYRLRADLYDGVPCLGFCVQPLRQVNLIASDVSDGSFLITDPDAQAPTISSIRPNEGTYGMQVTLRGRGFTERGNLVRFSRIRPASGEMLGYQVSSDARSADGTTLSFIVPDSTGVCPYNPYEAPPKDPVACIALAVKVLPGDYEVYVINANGTSNRVRFTLTEQR